MSVNLVRYNQDNSHPASLEDSTWLSAVTTTPAFVYDEERLSKNLSLLNNIRSSSGCRILYSIKAFPFTGLLKMIRGMVDGFSVSSLFEARLAHEVLADQGSLHITTPGLRKEEITEIGELCDYISFNSLSQLERFGPSVSHMAATGLRINPQLSFLDDPRYDPCRPYSKLGSPLNQVAASCLSGEFATPINGLHFHTHYGSRSFEPMQASVRHIENHLPQLVHTIDWINLGGGYLFQEASDLKKLHNIVKHINTNWGADVFFEPGKAVVNNTGFLVTSVIDLFECDGKSVAVLDSSVNHLPQVFEYQSRPELLNEQTDGTYLTTLAGCTCLSGDLFGEYAFSQPLAIGDRVAFKNVGAYSLIKASRFNGQNLPSIYTLDYNNELTLMKQYGYHDFYQQWSESPPSMQRVQTKAE